MQNCHPRLSEYFQGSYGKLQQQISLFIKGFPLIQLQNLGSINDLIGLLIQQNSMLSTRFRQQLAQIKENFKRQGEHEQELKVKMDVLREEVKFKEREVQQEQNRVRGLEGQVEIMREQTERLKGETERMGKAQTNLHELETGVKELRPKIMAALNQLLQSRFIKNPDIFTEKLGSFRDQLMTLIRIFPSKRMDQQRLRLQQDMQRFSDLIQQKCKHERNKQKSDKQKTTQLLNTIQQMYCTVADFSSRCKQTSNVIKMVQEQDQGFGRYCEGLEAELNQLDRTLRQMRSAEGTARKSTEPVQRGSFEEVLKSLSASMGDGRKSKQHIEDVERYKAEIRELNAKIRQDSQDFERYMEESEKSHRQQISMKQELLKYYQQNLIETKQRLQSQQARSDSLSKQLRQVTSELQTRQQTINDLEHQKTAILIKVDEAQQVIMLLEEEKNKLEGSLKQKEALTDRKVVELAEQLTETERVKRNLADQYERDRMELMKQVEQERRTQVQLTNNLLALKQTIQKENQALTLKAAKVAELQQVRDIQARQAASMADLIKELEIKLREQATELRKRQTQNLQQQKRIKVLLSQNQNNLTQIKTIKQTIPDIASLRANLEQSEIKLSRLTEQNQSLKSLLKMSKADVQQCRSKITLLMEVQHQRQILRLKCDAYAKQIDKIHKQKEELDRQSKELKTASQRIEPMEQALDRKKIQMLTLQAENNRLQIELKHSRGLLRKIEQLREVI